MQKIKIGVLGATRGMDFLAKVLLNHPYAEVTAICENHPALREKTESEIKNLSVNINTFADYDDFLNSGIDAVIVANFANEHAPYAIKALNKGIHVLSENLPCQTMKEAVELCEAVEKSGKIYAYGENYCYLPIVLEMRRIFESGEMGEVMHAEGNFMNDCSFKWHLLTRGDRNHWRNFVPSTFYCTHSIGPTLSICGRRAEKVVGMETKLMPFMAEVGARSGSAAMEIMELDNGGMAKSINGNYRRRGHVCEYRLIAENGAIETDIYNFGDIHLFKARKDSGIYDETIINPTYTFNGYEMHSYKDIGIDDPFGLSDIYLINAFIQSILGDEKAKKYMIDIYRALDFSTVGLLAYRSILEGSNAVKIPNMRNKAERDVYKNDNKSTDASISFGDDLLPSCKSGFVNVDDEVYKRVAKKFEDTPITTGMH